MKVRKLSLVDIPNNDTSPESHQLQQIVSATADQKSSPKGRAQSDIRQNDLQMGQTNQEKNRLKIGKLDETKENMPT